MVCLDLPLTQANVSNIFQHGELRFKKISYSPQPIMGSPLENTRALINNIVSLTRSLSTSIPLATDEEKIFAVINSPKSQSF
jgi:hypothetical protein